MHSPRNRLLPSLERIVFAYLTTETKQGLAIKIAEGEPPPLHPHPHSSITLAYAIAIIPQNLSCVSTLYEDFFIIHFSRENLSDDQISEFRYVGMYACFCA
jgi:hypothetical protein